MEFAEKLITLRKGKELRQKQMLDREQKRACVYKNSLYSLAVYLIFLAGHYFYFSFGWKIWGKPAVFAEFFIATAIVIWIWARSVARRC